VNERRVNRFVSDLLRGRRPKRFGVEDHEAAEMRAAITLRAARPGAGTPREEFVTDLRRRLAEHVQGQDGDPAAQPGATRDRDAADRGSPGIAEPVPMRRPGELSRRRMVATTGMAAGAAAIVGAGADHLIDGPGPEPALAGSGPEQTLEPNVGQWRTVAASADLPEGGATGFDLGTVAGFVARRGGAVEAVSGMCTHLGCKLALNRPAQRLDCPCHNTSFALGGQLLRHQLSIAPPPLPKFHVREENGDVQIFAPPQA
jgi:nitrite reductase/ring-hydroxylating ferredoxin subunit